MKKQTRNYIFMGLGFLTILILIGWDLLSTINWLLLEYNQNIQLVNRIYDVEWNEIEIGIFGHGVKDITFFIDFTLSLVIILIVVMVFLKIYWSVKHDNANLH